MIVHLIDGTYELFRHFYGLRRFTKGKDRPYGGVVGVLQGVLQMIETGRVKDFVSRGSRGRTRADVLRLPIAFRERQWVLHRFFDGLEEAVVGAYTGRLVRHEVARSVEVNLLRGVHGA